MADSTCQEPRLPHGWACHVSRSTGHKYYYNFITNSSTYDISEVLKSPEPISQPLSQHYNPALQLKQMKQHSDFVHHQHMAKQQQFSSFPKDRTIPGLGNGDPGFVPQQRNGFDMSVAELQILLDQKKRKMRESRDECSSLESGFCSQSSTGAGSLDDGDSDRELRSGIGQRLKRKVNMWHAKTLQLEREEKQKRLKLLEEDIPREDVIDNPTTEVVNHEKSQCKKNIAKNSGNDDDDEDSELDMYGADDDDLEQLARIKEKFKDSKSSEKAEDMKKEVSIEDDESNEMEHHLVEDSNQSETLDVNEKRERKKSELITCQQNEENELNNNSPPEEIQLGILNDYDNRNENIDGNDNLDFSHDEDLALVKDYKYIEPRFSSDSESHDDYSSGADEL